MTLTADRKRTTDNTPPYMVHPEELVCMAALVFGYQSPHFRPEIISAVVLNLLKARTAEGRPLFNLDSFSYERFPYEHYSAEIHQVFDFYRRQEYIVPFNPYLFTSDGLERCRKIEKRFRDRSAEAASTTEDYLRLFMMQREY